MRRSVLAAALLSALPVAVPARPGPETAPAPRPVAPVAAVVESSLATAKGQIRQFAFDGNPDTYFVSEKNPTPAVKADVIERNDGSRRAEYHVVWSQGKVFYDVLASGAVLSRLDGATE